MHSPREAFMPLSLVATLMREAASLLFGQPERSFFTKELMGLAGGGSDARTHRIC
jgi:hypothetical protein